MIDKINLHESKQCSFMACINDTAASASTVKLCYNVYLGTRKISMLYPRYVVTKNSTVHTFISNPNTCTPNAPIKRHVIHL